MPAFLRRYKKTFLITASLFLVLLSGMGIGYFPAMSGLKMENLKPSAGKSLKKRFPKTC